MLFYSDHGASGRLGAPNHPLNGARSVCGHPLTAVRDTPGNNRFTMSDCVVVTCRHFADPQLTLIHDLGWETEHLQDRRFVPRPTIIGVVAGKDRFIRDDRRPGIHLRAVPQTPRCSCRRGGFSSRGFEH